MVYHSVIILTIYHWNLFLMIYQLTAWLDPPSIFLLKVVNWKPPALWNDLIPRHSLFSITLVLWIVPLFGSQDMFYILRWSTIVRFWTGAKYAFILSSGRRACERGGWKGKLTGGFSGKSVSGREHMKVEELEIDSLKTICVCVSLGKF